MLSRSDIIANASSFSKAWKDAIDEDADAKSFWDELFQVFGTPRKNVAKFEAPVKRADGTTGYIDLLWKGKLLVEHKSRGKSLQDARKQAQEYILNLKPADRPEWLAVCDFETFEVVDQRNGSEYRFTLDELPKHIDTLGFIGGFVPKKPSKSTPVNIAAVEILGDIYDSLKAGGYNTHELPQLMVRLLFILFAEDTAILEPDQFRDLLLDTKEDATDLGPLLNYIFELLNTPQPERQKSLPSPLANLPYVNGALFSTRLHSAAMTPDVRAALLRATEFDWTQISPAIFGSLFQSVMEGKERRALGAHYTSEDDILKLIRPLFLDGLTEELNEILADKTNRRINRLKEFHQKLASLKLLDPACGCGNFLIIAYRELRHLETRLLSEFFNKEQAGFLDISLFAKLNVDMMYGIELEEFPAEIAKVGMWLMDHICNTELAAELGRSFTRLPLKASATIKCANALTTDWNVVLPSNECSYIMGNPPFVGKKEQTEQQKAELVDQFPSKAKVGNLDYVTAWYVKAAHYIKGTRAECAFVSTNSISQGEQVADLWNELFRLGICITFAHRTFPWHSEARGKAHVHVVIIGFANRQTASRQKWIFDHSDSLATRVIPASNINPYLVDAGDCVVSFRSNPVCSDAPEMAYGSMMIDKDRSAGDEAGLVFSEEEAKRIIATDAALVQDIRLILGGDEFLNGTKRFCLWAPNSLSQAAYDCDILKRRIETVRQFRLSSSRPQTKKLASVPYRFGEVRQPRNRYIFVPKVSSERRKYIPIGLMEPIIVASGSALVVDDATLYHFGVMSSLMHNAWMRLVAGRMKSDYQYSAGIVYNNFVWPEDATDFQKSQVEDAAQRVLDVRTLHSDKTLAFMYDPHSMPVDLVKAHDALDRAVEECYRKQPFANEADRVQFLVGLYEAKTSPSLLKSAAKVKGRRKSS